MFLEDVVKAANVFARPLKNGDEDGDAPIGEGGEGRENAGCDGERFVDISELDDGDLEVIGNVRLLIFEFDDRGFQSVLRLFARDGSSGGISSAGGIGRPLTAATSWCSVQESE